MDRSFWLLTRLRTAGAYRRWKRSLARPKGIVVSIVFAFLFAPSIVGMAAIRFVPAPPIPSDLIDRVGPVAFCVLTILTLCGSVRDSSLYFAPAEIDFLFPGPFRRRQLIAYKLTMVVLGSLFSALIIGCSSRIMSTRFAASLIGAALGIVFIQLVQMVLALAINLVGTLTWTRVWRFLVVGLLGLVLVAVFPSRAALLATDWPAVGRAVELSPATALLLAPFRPFVFTFTAPTWSGLAAWGSLALAVDLVLMGLIFALDAGYLEASSLASGKRLAQVKKVIGGGGTVKMGRRRTGWLRFRPPAPVWMGGVGPNLWRQLTSAMGDPARLVVILGIVGGVCWFHTWILPRTPDARSAILPVGAAMAGPLIFLLSMFLSFDFRGDLDVMETLKTLPIAPSRLALGQVLTPAILATLIQAGGCLGLILGTASPPEEWPPVLVVLTYLFPANLFFFGIENLLFLWYPSRMVAGQFNGLAVARQMLLVLAKGVAVLLAVGIVAAVGALGYFASGRQLGVALVLAWLVLLGLAIAVLPLLGRAFLDFDVTFDTPA